MPKNNRGEFSKSEEEQLSPDQIEMQKRVDELKDLPLELQPDAKDLPLELIENKKEIGADNKPLAGSELYEQMEKRLVLMTDQELEVRRVSLQRLAKDEFGVNVSDGTGGDNWVVAMQQKESELLNHADNKGYDKLNEIRNEFMAILESGEKRAQALFERREKTRKLGT